MDAAWKIWDAYEVIRLPGYIKAIRIGPDGGGGIVDDDHELLLTHDDAKFILDAINNHARLTEENQKAAEELRLATTIICGLYDLADFTGSPIERGRAQNWIAQHFEPSRAAIGEKP